MNVFLNEDCIYSREDLDPQFIIGFLDSNLSRFKGTDIKCYTNTSALESFFQESGLSSQLKTLFLSILRNTESLRNPSRQYYYHYFKHQDFDLSVSENLSDSSLSEASDRMLQKEKVAVLNIPISHYCGRSVIPIIRSSYDAKNEDFLASIPCFDSSEKILRFFFVNVKLQGYFVDKEQFQKFCTEYFKVIESFDYSTWKPKTLMDNDRLEAKIAFPASSTGFLSDYFNNLKIENSNYNENVAKYVHLGTTVLELNGYSKNFLISAHYNREIFEGGFGLHKLLISLDTENGLLEVIERDGTHIGVYNYAGIYQRHYTDQKDIDTHSLKKLSPRLFLYN